MEIDPAVDALISALLALGRTSAYQAERRPLELIWVGCGKDGRILSRYWLANNLVCVLDGFTVGITQPMPDQTDCEMRDINANPLTIQLLSRRDGRPATAEWV